MVERRGLDRDRRPPVRDLGSGRSPSPRPRERVVGFEKLSAYTANMADPRELGLPVARPRPPALSRRRGGRPGAPTAASVPIPAPASGAGQIRATRRPTSCPRSRHGAGSRPLVRVVPLSATSPAHRFGLASLGDALDGQACRPGCSASASRPAVTGAAYRHQQPVARWSVGSIEPSADPRAAECGRTQRARAASWRSAVTRGSAHGEDQAATFPRTPICKEDHDARDCSPRTIDVHAHCDLPCGVYDPAQARIEAESVKAIMQSTRRQTTTPSGTRAISIKEQRSDLVKHHLWVLWTDYFKPPHFEKYPELHTLFNEATKLAGAAGTKATTDVAGPTTCWRRSTRSPRSSGRPRRPERLRTPLTCTYSHRSPGLVVLPMCASVYRAALVIDGPARPNTWWAASCRRRLTGAVRSAGTVFEVRLAGVVSAQSPPPATAGSPGSGSEGG